ncbi:MAG: metallophosphoesterase [Planctomycetota bacterium]
MSLSYGLLQSVDLAHPRLPPTLEGLRIAHLTDPHLPAGRRATDRAVRQLGRVRIDLLVVTGDYMDRRANRGRAIAAARALIDELGRAFRPRLGAFGVFGNHDHPDLIDPLLAAPAPDDGSRGVTWLVNAATDMPDLHLRLAGLSDLGSVPADAIRLSLGLVPAANVDDPPRPDAAAHERPFTLGLLHRPDRVVQAAALGIDLVLAGHSHGGQIRAPWGQCFHNSSDLPLRATAGLMRHRDTLMAVSRGLGRTAWTPRLFCPPHLPIYTLRRGPLPTTDPADVVCFRPW